MLVPNQIISNNHQRHNLRGQKYFCLFKEGVISLAVVSGLFVAASFYKTAYLFFITRPKPVPDRNLLCKVCLVHGTFMLAALTAAVRGMTPSLLAGIDLFFYIEETFARLRRRNKVESFSASNIIGNSGFLLIVV